MGVSDIQEGLFLYIVGYEPGLNNLERWRRSFEGLAKRAGVEATLPLNPPYFKELLEIVLRCIRRPSATARMAQRAEWLANGQIVGQLGPPPWSYADDNIVADKLLDDVAAFLVMASKLDKSYYQNYSRLLSIAGGSETSSHDDAPEFSEPPTQLAAPLPVQDQQPVEVLEPADPIAGIEFS
jgi:hypothetical protein